MFFAFVTSKGVAIPQEARDALMMQFGSVEALQAFVKDACASGEMPPAVSESELCDEVAKAAKAHPKRMQQTENLSEAPQDALVPQTVSDVHAFKQGLTPSKPAMPVLPWSAYMREPHTPLTETQYTAPTSTASAVRANM